MNCRRTISLNIDVFMFCSCFPLTLFGLFVSIFIFLPGLPFFSIHFLTFLNFKWQPLKKNSNCFQAKFTFTLCIFITNKSFLQNVCQSQDCFEVYSEIFTNKKDFKKHSMLSKSFHILCITFLFSYCVYL